MKKKQQGNSYKKNRAIPCEKCGFPVSPYYFTAVVEGSKKRYPKCPNCGHFDDPE